MRKSIKAVKRKGKKGVILFKPLRFPFFRTLILFSLYAFTLFAPLRLAAQQPPFRVMFYNVENLFDPENDPNKNDEEFTPDGVKRWDNFRYYKKINNLAKVITAVGEWDTPAIVGMCEVENAKTIDDLTTHSLLRQRKYHYVMTNSPDRRGIDVVLMYQRDRFKLLNHNCIRIDFPYNKRKKTRDVLHVTGQVISGDTLDIFVCHFPSRRGGQQQSEPDRVYVASVVRAQADSLMKVRRKANILIMGDFNDEPSDKSMAKTLTCPNNDGSQALVNLWLPISKTSKIGSYKFRNKWNFLDQMVVSANLLEPENSIHVIENSAQIVKDDFLLTEDQSHKGWRPKKTFHGQKYEAGYSDHLPIKVDFSIFVP